MNPLIRTKEGEEGEKPGLGRTTGTQCVITELLSDKSL